MTDHDFNRSIVNEVPHRPWPMPDAPWVMTQTWHDLLFAHWPVEAGLLRGKVPSAFELDLLAGTAWIGIVPFRMTNVALRCVPSLPGVSAFPELNVRTYVRVNEKPGVYFFSLDAGSALAVRAARMLLNLPYYRAAMTVGRDGDAIVYDSARQDGAAVLSVRYRPTGPARQAGAGTIEHFLAERYCLYHVDRKGAPYRLDIHHPPWPLQSAEAVFTRNTMAAAAGVSLPEAPALLHFSKRQDMVAWAPASLAP